MNSLEREIMHLRAELKRRDALIVRMVKTQKADWLTITKLDAANRRLVFSLIFAGGVNLALAVALFV